MGVPGALLLSSALSVLAVGLVRAYALRRSVLDRPNDRSSHRRATPRGGGVGLVLAFMTVVIITEQSNGTLDWRMLVAFLGVASVALVGWWDDHSSLSVPVRLVTHAIAGLTLIPMILNGTPIPMFLGVFAPLWWVFWAVSAINVVNFMDGIDGIIGGQLLVFGSHLLAAGGWQSHAGLFGGVLAGSTIGFLCWNWAPAKIFLGDAGSGATGFIAVLGGAMLMRETRTGLVAAYLPLFPLFLDATVTILRRIRRGEKLAIAHRSHLYQRLANGGWGHARVSLLYTLAAAAGAAIVEFSTAESWGWLVTGYVGLVFAGGALLDRLHPTSVDGERHPVGQG